MARSLVDTAALEQLHQSLLVALRSGAAPWFADVLRDHDEVGDLSDRGRRKMPAMMRARTVGTLPDPAPGGDHPGAGPRTGLPGRGGGGQLVSIEPRNLTAQLHHRAAGNPPSTLPDSAISNCFPGLEFDFRNLWRRVFEDIEVHEAAASWSAPRARCPGSRAASCFPWRASPTCSGCAAPPPPRRTPSGDRLAGMVELPGRRAGELGRRAGAGEFFDPESETSEEVELRVRPIFARSEVTGEITALIDEVIAEPGELTQSLCSPWQNDYRECGCYYWAASRPDYVNVEPTASGRQHRQQLDGAQPETQALRAGQPRNPRQLNYEDLFRNWQGLLRFIVEGRDHD